MLEFLLTKKRPEYSLSSLPCDLCWWSDEEWGDRDDHKDIPLLSYNYETGGHLRRHLNMHSAEKSNKCNHGIKIYPDAIQLEPVVIIKHILKHYNVNHAKVVEFSPRAPSFETGQQFLNSTCCLLHRTLKRWSCDMTG